MFKIDEKITVKLNASLSNKGQSEIAQLIYNDHGITIDNDNYDGFELKNTKGRITKRLSKSIKKQFDVKLSPDKVSQIGNIAFNNTVSGTYTFNISHDLDVWQGAIIKANDGSCFQTGGQYHHCWVGMNDDLDYYCVRIWHDDDLIARAWLKSSNDSLAIFNAYGMTLDKLSLIVAQGLGQSVKKAIYNYSNLFINSNRVNLVGTGDTYDLNPHIEGMYTCEMCADHIHEDDTYYGGGMTLCEHCFSENYSYCESCSDTELTEDGQWVNNEFYCEYCYDQSFTVCDDCGESVADDELYDNYCENCYNDNHTQCIICEYYELTEGGAQIDDEFYCYSCKNDYTECKSCNDATHNNEIIDGNCEDCTNDTSE